MYFNWLMPYFTDIPGNQVPVLITEEFGMILQSNAIVRYVAKRLGKKITNNYVQQIHMEGHAITHTYTLAAKQIIPRQRLLHCDRLLRPI